MTTRINRKSAISRPMFVKPVGSFVPKLAQKAFEKYGFSTVALLTDWAFIVGAELGALTRPERLKWPKKVAVYGDVEQSQSGRPGATLVLRVDPSRALEIQYASAQLIERINSYFGYNAVAALRIVQAPVEPVREVLRPRGRVDSGPSALGSRGDKDLSPQGRLAAALSRLQASI